MDTKLTIYLKEFKAEIEEYFIKHKWTYDNFKFFQEFYRKEKLLKLRSSIPNETDNWEENKVWKEIVKIRKRIHSLGTPAWAGSRALGKFPNHPLERYIDVFLYLVYGDEDTEKRIVKIINRENGYNLNYFGFSSLSEIVAQAFPDNYVFYNKRNKTAVKFLDIKLNLVGGESDGEEFLRYNKALEPVIKEYAKIIYSKEPEYFSKNRDKLVSKTSLPHELDQFFNWVYENKIFDKDKKEAVKITEPIGNVSKIRLNSYLHFEKDLEIDLTYPDGHEKKGQPLEKVCIIGQSGTGKTSLLNLIKGFTSLNKKDIPTALSNSVEVFFKYEKFELLTKPDENNELICNVLKTGNSRVLKNYESKPRLINFPAYSVGSIDKIAELNEKFSRELNINLDSVVDFTEEEISNRIWKKVLDEINKYRKEQFDIMIKINKKILNSEKIDPKLIKELNEFSDKANPLIKLNKFLEDFLEEFHLEVKTKIDEYNLENLIFPEFISTQDESKKVIPTIALSTGTKQVLSKSIPLYQLAPFHSIVLIDEPENSLYPDIQKKFVNFLLKEPWIQAEEKEKTCQFFFATHSPTIASNFEPWEIIELKFNNEGKVYQDKYFKGKRHVDNYFKDPRLLRWDSLLMDMFGLKEEGNQDFREQAIMELKELEYKISVFRKKEQTDSNEHDTILSKITLLKQKLGFEYEKN